MSDYKHGKIVAMKTADYVNFVAEVLNELGKEKAIQLLQGAKHEFIVLEESVYNDMKSAVPTVQCSCECMNCHNE